MKHKALLFTALILVMGCACAPVFGQSKIVGQGALLSVTVNVPNARITVDNIVVTGGRITLTPGSHTLLVTAPGYQDYTQRIDIRSPMSVKVTLQPLSTISVVASVNGALIFVDGVQIGGNAYAVAPGSHTVRVTAPGYQDYNVTVNVNGPVTVNAQLIPITFAMTVSVNVRNAAIFVDGAQISGTRVNVTLGTHTVRVSAPGFQDYQSSVNVAGPVTVSAQLVPAGFMLTINANVRNADIFVDGAQISGNAIAVSRGNHSVKVSARGYIDYQTTVSVNGPMVVNAQLVPAGYALTVTSNVIGASVIINNVEKGQTPYSELLPGGAYTVIVSAPGFKTYTTSLTLNGPITVSARLIEAPPAVVSLILPRGLLDPKGHEFNQIKVYIDGKVTNVKRDLSGITIPAGRHKIAVSSGDLYVESQDLDLEGGRSYTLELFMELRLGNPR